MAQDQDPHKNDRSKQQGQVSSEKSDYEQKASNDASEHVDRMIFFSESGKELRDSDVSARQRKGFIDSGYRCSYCDNDDNRAP
jgi:hypothetical protein